MLGELVFSILQILNLFMNNARAAKKDNDKNEAAELRVVKKARTLPA